MTKYILRRDEIEALAGIDKTHFLSPKAQRNNKSLGDLTGITGLGFHIVSVEPGFDSTELHVHYHEDECVYVLEGEADAIIGDQTYHVRAGDFIGYRAGGEPHLLRNTGTQTLRCIVVGQRLDHDVADYPEKGRRLYRNSGLAWNMVPIDAIEEPVGGRKV